MLFNKNQVLRIRKMFSAGISISEISDLMRCSYDNAERCIKRETYYDPTYIAPPTRKPLDKEFCRAMAKQNKTLAEISCLESKRSGQRPYSVTTIRKCLVEERTCTK